MKQRDRVLDLFKADLDERQREVTARERNVAVAERNFAAQLKQISTPEPPVRPSRKLGRNESCWCESGQKYKNCHLLLDG